MLDTEKSHTLSGPFPEHSSLRKKGCASTHSLRVQSIMLGKPRRQELVGAAAHVTCTVMKLREMGTGVQLTASLSLSLGPNLKRKCHSHSKWVFSPQITHSKLGLSDVSRGW